ncbi:hypothetical protein M9H77_07728 [Catharanthus roseus]|uniref:Uncharacterized protein n=1 Tax=Catharanthus roseus TaxID=4058 RepID=A0ACC0BVS0_CATRO|nr:hypothetical protein M9H77_07728 [Catharanthus roseus]
MGAKKDFTKSHYSHHLHHCKFAVFGKTPASLSLSLSPYIETIIDFSGKRNLIATEQKPRNLSTKTDQTLCLFYKQSSDIKQIENIYIERLKKQVQICNISEVYLKEMLFLPKMLQIISDNPSYSAQFLAQMTQGWGGGVL